jgi:hypothetical protein
LRWVGDTRGIAEANAGRSTSWAGGLELVGDYERCVALARLLAERTGLTAGISAAMRRPGYDPDPCGALEETADGQGGEHDGQVGLDPDYRTETMII